MRVNMNESAWRNIRKTRGGEENEEEDGGGK
jgi:hypothetical protein